MLKPVKVRIIQPSNNKVTLAGAFGCVRWVWNQSLATMSQTYKETGKGISALTMKKQIPVWKTEHEWLKECYSQCLQSSVLNLSQAFINFFDGRAAYPTFKKRQGRQSMQYPQNVKILSHSEIKFPGNLGVVIGTRAVGQERRTLFEQVSVDAFQSLLVPLGDGGAGT